MFPFLSIFVDWHDYFRNGALEKHPSSRHFTIVITNRMSSYGQRGVSLLQELKRSDWLPPYNENGVRQTLEEISLHIDALIEEVEQHRQKQERESKPSIFIHEAAIRRNKRCLLAYHAHRLKKLRSLRWETTGMLTTNIKSLLDESEVDFFNQYDELISNYSTKINMDLSTLCVPDKEYVQVRVVKDVGLAPIMTEFGNCVKFDAGSVHFLRRGDVEHLIRQEVLIEINGEEE